MDAVAGRKPRVPVTLRTVLAIAVPMTLAHATTPLIGITDTAVIGQLGDVPLLGAVALGALMFNSISATTNFLRMGTTGLVAQAMGAGDAEAEATALWRSLALAAIIGLAIVVLQGPVFALFLAAMKPSAAVAEATRDYWAVRVWGTPFMLANYAVLGWLLGLARARTGLLLQALLCLVNVVGSLLLVLVFDLAIAGVAAASVAAEVCVFAVSAGLVAASLKRGRRPSLEAIFERTGFRRTLAVNRDILIRSLLLTASYALFMSVGGRLGDLTLAANAVLMNLFMISAHLLDGLATAAEQLAGRSVGARDRAAFTRTVRLTVAAGFVVALALVLVWIAAGPLVIRTIAAAPEVREASLAYLGWAVLTAPAGVLAFVMDGLFIGATWTATMRNMMLAATVTFALVLWATVGLLGNHSLWLAFNVWLLARGLTLFVFVPRLVRRTFG